MEKIMEKKITIKVGYNLLKNNFFQNHAKTQL